MDKGDVNPASLNHVSQYGGLGHGPVNPALIAHQNTMNPTSLAATGLNQYGLSGAALPGLSREPAASSLPYNSLSSSSQADLGHQLFLQAAASGRTSLGANSSTQLDLGRQLFLQGTASGRPSLGAGSYGISPYGSSGYGSHSYGSFGGAASQYGIPSSSFVAQTAAYDGASHYPLASHQSQLPGTSPSSGVLPGMRSYYTS
jgi:hypothetical protein